MAIISRNRNILPANAVTADRASHLVEQVMPIQQQRMQAAFRVQGVQAAVYQYLHGGRPCTCKSSETQTKARLGVDGKADTSVINELITNHSFSVTAYTSGVAKPKADAVGDFYNPNAFSDFNNVGGDETINNRITDERSVGDNGQFDPDTLDDILKDFDVGQLGYTDVSCAVCFGSGYVGGYSSYRGYRAVLTPGDMEISGTIDTAQTPWVASPGTSKAVIVLPKGAVGIDTFRVLCGRDVVVASIKLDGVLIKNALHVRSFFDGRPHVLEIFTTSEFTHVEIQAVMSSISAFLELPKRTKSSDLLMLDPTEPFQVLVSPDVPVISSQDVIVESQSGAALLVQSASPWQTRARGFLGHECQVRVVQPLELFTLLPRRGYISHQQAAAKIHMQKSLSRGI